jgi:hypothetical protein
VLLRIFICYSFRVVIYYEMNTDVENYKLFIIDDCDSDDDDDDGDDGDGDGDGTLDTNWITKYETEIMNDEYHLFLKTEIVRIGIEILYLDRDKTCVERVIPVKYTLNRANQITQNEIFSIVQSHQKLDKKYYNFQSLLLYKFDFQYNTDDIVRGLSDYIRHTTAPTTTTTTTTGDGAVADVSQFIEYTNLLSIDVIYFPPTITMFHDFIGFSVLLYND